MIVSKEWWQNRGRGGGKGMRKGGGKGIYKADGSRVKNPQAFFKSGRVTEKFYTVTGQLVKNPLAYAKVSRKGGGKGMRKGGGKGAQGIYKADGSRVKNPQAFFKSGQVTEKFYTATGA